MVSALGVLLLPAPAIGEAADRVVVGTQLQGNAVVVAASALLRVSPAVIWQTLTDYENLADFVPGMTSSHVVARQGHTVVVAQTGRAGFPLPAYQISIVVEVREYPPSAITMKLLRGNLRKLNGTYRIENTARGDENVLRWNGVVEPEMVVSSVIVAAVLQENIGDQFRGVIHEIERRAAGTSQPSR